MLCKPTKIIKDEYTLDELYEIKTNFIRVLGYINIDVISEHIITNARKYKEHKQRYNLYEEHRYIVKPILVKLFNNLKECNIGYHNKYNTINIDKCDE